MSKYYLECKDNPELLRQASSMFATSKILESCPAIILVFSDSTYIDRSKMESISDALSIGASVEHMALKATDPGLGSLWIADTYFVHKELAEYVESYLAKHGNPTFINKSDRLVCALAIGERREPKYDRPRKAMEDILLIINN